MEETKHDNAIVRNSHPAERQTETISKYDVCNLSALMSAEERCHRGVGYKNSVSRYHMLALSKNYDTLQELINGKYKTQKGDSFEIFEPKHRTVTSTKYKDRIPQTSFVLNYIYPKVISQLIDNNFSCIKDRGVDAAREEFKRILRLHTPNDYVLKADLKGYFESINHQKLFDVMSEYINDIWAMEYYQDVINSNEQEIGITLGSEINQLSAVAFLNKLDHMLDDGDYERYMDDFVYVGTKNECEEVLKIIEKITSSLGLTLSKKKTYIQPLKQPVKFLGFTFLLHDTGKITMKRCKDKLNNEKRKLRRMKKKNIPFDKIMEHYTCVRAVMKKGSRSGVVKLDRYFNNLFAEEIGHMKVIKKDIERKKLLDDALAKSKDNESSQNDITEALIEVVKILVDGQEDTENALIELANVVTEEN